MAIRRHTKWWDEDWNTYNEDDKDKMMEYQCLYINYLLGVISEKRFEREAAQFVGGRIPDIRPKTLIVSYNVGTTFYVPRGHSLELYVEFTADGRTNTWKSNILQMIAKDD